MTKAEFTLVKPTAADLTALFEQIKGRKATAQERKYFEAEMADAEQRIKKKAPRRPAEAR
jgi:hypothetical protein